MNNRSKYLLKNVGILSISNFASKILVFLLVPLYTSVLTTEEVGLYDLVTSTVLLLFPILTLNIVDALMRFLMDETKNKEEIAVIGIKFIILSIIIVFIFLLVISTVVPINKIQGLEIYIFLFFVFNCLNQYFIQFAKGIELVLPMAVAGILATITMIISNIILLLVLKIGLIGFFIANIASQAVPTCYLFYKTQIWKYLNTKKINKELQKEMLMYCVPLIATAVGWWVNSSSDKYIVSFIRGVAANGLLAVSYKVPAIINTVQSIFIQAWQISAVKEYGGEESADFYGRTFVIFNFLISLICSGLIFLSKPIGHLLYKKEFYIAWMYVPFLVIAGVLNSASGFLGPILSAKKMSKPMAMSAVYGAVVNIIFNIILVYLIGIQGATIATVIASFVIYLVRKKAVGKEIKIERYSLVYLSWILLCLQAIIEIYTNIWWIEILVILLIIFINNEVVKDVLNMVKKLL